MDGAPGRCSDQRFEVSRPCGRKKPQGRGTATCGGADTACAGLGLEVSRPFAKNAKGRGTATCGGADTACAGLGLEVSRPFAKNAKGRGTATCGGADTACAGLGLEVSRPFAKNAKGRGTERVGVAERAWQAVWSPAQCTAGYCLTTSRSILSFTSSPTMAAGNLLPMPKSDRLMVVVAEKPACGL